MAIVIRDHVIFETGDATPMVGASTIINIGSPQYRKSDCVTRIAQCLIFVGLINGNKAETTIESREGADVATVSFRIWVSFNIHRSVLDNCAQKAIGQRNNIF